MSAPSRNVGDGLLFAFGTLTAFRVPPPSRVDARVVRLGMTAAVLPGVALGGLAALVVWLGGLAGVPAGLCAIGALGVVALATRFIHLDGLADTADGMAAPVDREQAIAVMRKSDVGPTAVIVLVLVLLLQVTALEHVIWAGHGPWAVLGAIAAGRAALTLVCVRGVPSARIEGLGAAVAGSVPRWQAAVVLVTIVAVVAGAAVLAAQPVWPSVLAVSAGWLGAALVTARCVRRLGGVTGDVLGATVETGVTVSLIVLAVA